jgi:hypothetical protein
MGYADAIFEPGSSLHGVVHVITEEELDVLDKIEIFYKRKVATARLYNGVERPVQVYYAVSDANPSIPDDFHQPGIPQERYLDVLTAGAKHYGVRQSYIDWLQNHEKIPRPSTDSMRSLGSIDGLPIVSLADVEYNNGYGGRPLWISVNRKVLESCFAPDSEKLASYRQRLKPEAGIVELHIGKILYDPKYGVIKSWEDITPGYSAWCEHWMVEHFETVKDLAHWKLVGHLELQKNLFMSYSCSNKAHSSMVIP